MTKQNSTAVTSMFFTLGSRLIIGILGILFSLGNTHAQYKSEISEVKLLQDYSSLSAGNTLTLGLHFKLAENWHIYYKDPGDSGLPPKLQVKNSNLLLPLEPEFPPSEPYVSGDIVNNVYHDEVLIKFPFHLDQNFSSDQVFSTRASWLICKEDCLPEEHVFQVNLKHGQSVKTVDYQTLHLHEDSLSLLVLLGFAFLGGLILNLMPCVFPVISIKLLEFINLSEGSRLKAIQHSLIFTAGVLVFTWGLFVLLEILRAAGEQVGWGFQLQSPIFVAFLTVLFLLLSLWFLGVFELGNKLVNSFSKIPKIGGYLGSFLNGALVVLVATPCTAPFMGVALGAALTLSTLQAFLIFTFLGLGIAFPYVLLSYSKRVRGVLPRPGAWMVRFKQLMALPLIATTIWLGFVFVKQVNFAAFNVKASYGMEYQQFSPDALEQALEEYQAVYVDFTASWCWTCQLNKRLVFSSGDVALYFKKHNILLMQADWTNQSPEITLELQKFARQGVPLNVIYRLGHAPIVLPTILTEGIVLEKFDEIID